MPDLLGVLQPLATLLLATSLAAERLVTIVKTFFPSLAVEKTTAAQEVDLAADKWRRLGVQALALAASYVTLALIFNVGNPTAKVPVGQSTYYLGLLAFLGSGGSAFWGGVVGYVKEAKDVRTAEKANARLTYLANSSGKTSAQISGVGLHA